MTEYVACFVRRGSGILLGRRTDSGATGAGRAGGTGDGGGTEKVEDAREGTEDGGDAVGQQGSEHGVGDVWDIVHETAGADPETTAVDAVERIADATLVRTGQPVYPDDDTAVHPFLFDVSVPLLKEDASERSADSESTLGGTVASDAFEGTEWAAPTELLRRETPPGRWRAYEVVAPTVRSVAADDEHGSAYISLRGLEVLRDRAAIVADESEDGSGELVDLAARLRRARPSMAALHNRVNRAVAESDGTPEGIEAAAAEGIDRALRADTDAASGAAQRADDAAVLTLSRSRTVLSALREADARALFVAESRPGNEGVGVAESLAESCPVTLHTDAAIAHVLREEPVDAVLVGADTVRPDGGVVNKTGTRVAALAADREGVPFLAVAASDKVATAETVPLESGDRAAVYDGDAPLDVRNPTFDVTPPDLVDGVVTERGTLTPDEVGEVADELRDLAARAQE
ncbi:initiation factor 2B [Halostella pelagica]|uniref:initiation factor 2B n=1 Tax=Halostella pelagica TaxID=2583824 RepID=UPI0010813F16|nr:initiation factor 2B [Halostella pelagica]